MKPGELPAVVRELDEGLHGAVVQKVYNPAPNELWLELRQPGRSTLLGVCARAGSERLCIAESRPPSPPTASGLQQRLRKHLCGKKLHELTLAGNTATLYFSTATLEVDFAAHKLEVKPPESRPERPPAPATGALTLARELGARETHDTDKEKRLERHKKKLLRTREKIAEEASRGPLAEQHKRDGELLSRNLHAVERGAKSVTLTEYAEHGPQERTLTLDPKRTPKQQAEWFFHQYKRLTRGVEIAKERLKKIDLELAAAEAPDKQPFTEPRAPDAPSLPYREYVTAKGQRIWVGRSAKHNDTLTFKVARPHHVWFHARGLTGAHVVVPLEKKQTLEQETLIDAAHLAHHYSSARDEPTGEVSYTHVRYLRKGDAPGQVTYTRETTFWLRVERARLQRLLGG